MISSFRREGTTEYTCRTLECNWQEERSRVECGETVKLSLMGGAVVAPLDPDLSIAPPTRVPGVASSGHGRLPAQRRLQSNGSQLGRGGADQTLRSQKVEV